VTARSVGETPVRFGVIGLNHNHIYGMTDLLHEAGGELAASFVVEADLVANFAERYPRAHALLASELALQAQAAQAPRVAV